MPTTTPLPPRLKERVQGRIKDLIKEGRYIVSLHIPGLRDKQTLLLRYPQSTITDENHLTRVFHTPKEVIAFILAGERDPKPVFYHISDQIRAYGFPSKGSASIWKQVEEFNMLAFMEEVTEEDVEKEFLRKNITETDIANIYKQKHGPQATQPLPEPSPRPPLPTQLPIEPEEEEVEQEHHKKHKK